MRKKALCILSGGLDSTTAAFMSKAEGFDIVTLHFTYGQLTQDRELRAFKDISDALGSTSTYTIDLGFFTQIGASALTDSELSVPTTGLEDGVPITYVPFRNGIFLSIASAIAERDSLSRVVIGVVEEDSSGYPDCTDEFIEQLNRSINIGTKPETTIVIHTPLIKLKKSQIVKKAVELDVPLHLTWSCYKNSTKACGVCDSCRLRLDGFDKAGSKDCIEYV